MRGRPATAVWAAVAVTAPLGILAAIGSGPGGTSIWIVLHACARLVATASSLPVVLAIALAASVWGLLAWHVSRQALIGRRAIRLAKRHAVVPPRDVLEASLRLGIRRLVVTELPATLAFCAGIVRPTVFVSTALVRSLEPGPLEAVLAHEAAHARHRDPLRQILSHAVARALWMAPAARRSAEHQRLLLELAADGHSMARAGRRALGEALLALHSTPATTQAPAIAGGGTALGARIDALVPGAAAPRLVLEASVVRRSAVGLVLSALLVVTVVVSPEVGSDAVLAMPMNGSEVADMTLAWSLRVVVVALGWIGARRWLRARSS